MGLAGKSSFQIASMQLSSAKCENGALLFLRQGIRGVMDGEREKIN